MPKSRCQNCGSKCRGTYCMARACRAAKQRADRHARNPELTPQPCSNCGRPTTVAGPSSERRYCMARDCRRAKYRWDYYARQAELDDTRVEDRRCSCCNAKMQVRPWRLTDLDYGRWCRKKECQDDRRKVEAKYDSDKRYWFDELDHLECPECGLKKGVRKGFAHLDFVRKKWCEHFGTLMPDPPNLTEFAKKEWQEEKERILNAD